MAYNDIAGSQTYIDQYIIETDPWDEASEIKKNKALNMATVIINQLNFKGAKTEKTQDNQFPRDDLEIPDDIKYACTDIALSILDGVDMELEYQSTFDLVQSVSNIKHAQDTTQVPAHIQSGVPSLNAWNKLIPYLRSPYDISIKRV